MKIFMIVFSLLVTGGGVALTYFSARKKFIKTRPGETMQDYMTRATTGDANDVLKRGVQTGCAAYFKIMGMIWGVAMAAFGVLMLVLTLMV